MRYFFALTILSLLTLSCGENKIGNKSDLIVQVGENKLTKSELEMNLPSELTKEDSLLYAENYIRSWIRDVLVFDVASKNISNKEEITRLVENYRKSLIIYQYKDQLVNEKLSKEISQNEIQEYYDANKNKFGLDKVLIKGLFLKIPADAPDINKIREWTKSTSQDAIENIEKYSVQNALSYDYFYNRWVEFKEVADKLPISYSDPETVVKQNKLIETQDSSFCYFLKIKEYCLPGDNAPFEFAETTVREILINQKKMDFLKKVEDNLYNTAQKKGQIKYYNE